MPVCTLRKPSIITRFALFDPSESTTTGGSGSPSAATTRTGTLFVADNNTNQISQITSHGVVSTFATGVFQPAFLVATPEPSRALLFAASGVSLLLRRRRNAA